MNLRFRRNGGIPFRNLASDHLLQGFLDPENPVSGRAENVPEILRHRWIRPDDEQWQDDEHNEAGVEVLGHVVADISLCPK